MRLTAEIAARTAVGSSVWTPSRICLHGIPHRSLRKRRTGVVWRRAPFPPGRRPSGLTEVRRCARAGVSATRGTRAVSNRESLDEASSVFSVPGAVCRDCPLGSPFPAWNPAALQPRDRIL